MTKMKNPRLNHVLPARNSCHWQTRADDKRTDSDTGSKLVGQKARVATLTWDKSNFKTNYLVETKKVYLKEKYVVIEYCAIWLYEINTTQT